MSTGTHNETIFSVVSKWFANLSTISVILEHGKILKVNHMASNKSQTALTTNSSLPSLRRQPQPTPQGNTTIRATSTGPKSYAATIGNVQVLLGEKRVRGNLLLMFLEHHKNLLVIGLYQESPSFITMSLQSYLWS